MRYLGKLSWWCLSLLLVLGWQTSYATSEFPSPVKNILLEPITDLTTDGPVKMSMTVIPKEGFGDTLTFQIIGTQGLVPVGSDKRTILANKDGNFVTEFEILIPKNDTSRLTVHVVPGQPWIQQARFFVTMADTVEYYRGHPMDVARQPRPQSDWKAWSAKWPESVRKRATPPDSNTSQFRTEPAPRSEYQLLEMRRIEQEPLIARVVDRASVLRYQRASGKTQELYRPDKYSIHELTVSPNNKYIAAINISDRVTIPDSVPDAYYMYSLMVLHASGELAHRLDMDVRRYVWSPDGKQIAFLTFAPCRKAFWSSCPTGAWILDVETSELTKISEGAKEINWAAFDGAIYLFEHPRLYERGRVMRWDPVSGELQPTDYHDIYFSPDGKYYLSLWKDEGRPIRLYNATSNELIYDLVVQERSLYGDTAVPFPEDLGSVFNCDQLKAPWGWVFNKGHYLMFTKEESTVELEGSGPVKIIVSKTIHSLTNSIYDVEQRKVIKQFEGDVRAWVGSGNQVVVERDGKVVLEEMP